MTKRDSILIVAEELFSELGFEGTSVRALAEKAGINVAMISYYFGSKEKLFEALVEFRAGATRTKLETLNREIEDPMKRVEQFVDIYVERIFSNHKFHRILYREISLQQRTGLNEAIINILLKNLEEIRKMIKDGEKKKVFRKVDVELTIATIIGTISQVTLSSPLSCKLIGTDPKNSSIYSDKNKTRLKVYLKDLLKCHLGYSVSAKNN